jgi:Cys-tRNA(Pro)/Cys-tRNA(Cys) deacylase
MSFDEAEAASGYPPGATPSLGYRKRMRVIIDTELAEMETLFCGGGSRDQLLGVKVKDVIRLNDTMVASISS